MRGMSSETGLSDTAFVHAASLCSPRPAQSLETPGWTLPNYGQKWDTPKEMSPPSPNVKVRSTYMPREFHVVPVEVSLNRPATIPLNVAPLLVFS
jgi:hypothetical protein